jgi:acyl-CoA synthetase (NDP forming)
MMDVTRLAVRGIFPVNNTLGVMTLSGGAGVIISDAAEAVGLAMPEMPIDSQNKLLALLPYAAPRNPVDVTAQYVNDMSLISKFTDTLVSDGNYRSILGFFTYAGGAPSVASRLREQMNIVRAKHKDCLFVLSLLGSSEQIDEYEKDGFSVFEDPNRAVYAIEAMGRFGRAFAKRKFLKPPKIEPFVLPKKTPNEIESKRLLYAAAGIVSAPEVLCNDSEKAVQVARSLGYPVVLKIVSPDILHKSDIGGVIVGVDNDAEVRRAYVLILKRVHQALGPELVVDGVLVAKQVSSGVECIMGIQQDPVFGPIAVVGLGGIFVDVFQDVSLRRCPFGVDVAKEMICSLKGVSLLQGARGRPPADITAAARALARLSVFAAQAGPRLRSIDINPILVRPKGQGALALDAVIELVEK